MRLIANGAGGAVTANITGALASTSGTGLFIDPPGAVVVNVATGASIAGGLNGINTTGATNAITIGGSISSTGAGTATLDGVNSLQSTNALSLAGPLSGAGSIVKQGAGQLGLSGSNWRVAELAGGSREDGTRLRRQSSRARAETKLVGGHVGDALGAVSVVIGGGYAWHDIDTSRTPGVAGLAAGATSSAKAHTIQGYGEIGCGVEYGGFTAVPFARFSYVHIVSDALTESGGLGALTVARDERDYKFGSAGLRLSGEAPVASGVTFLPRATISYTRGWDIGGGRTLAFAGAGIGRVLADRRRSGRLPRLLQGARDAPRQRARGQADALGHQRVHRAGNLDGGVAAQRRQAVADHRVGAARQPGEQRHVGHAGAIGELGMGGSRA